MAEELKACPFCGGEAEIERVGTARMSTIYFCTECSCRLETGETFNHGALWNRRAMPSQGGEAVEVVAYRVSLPSEPELGHWFDEHAESDPQMCKHEPLMTVAQHQRILAAATHPADQVAEPDAELVELMAEVRKRCQLPDWARIRFDAKLASLKGAP